MTRRRVLVTVVAPMHITYTPTDAILRMRITQPQDDEWQDHMCEVLFLIFTAGNIHFELPTRVAGVGAFADATVVDN